MVKLDERSKQFMPMSLIVIMERIFMCKLPYNSFLLIFRYDVSFTAFVACEMVLSVTLEKGSSNRILIHRFYNNRKPILIVFKT